MEYVGNFRKASSNEWNRTNPILPRGIVGIDTTVKKHKIGDGVNKWRDLGFVSGSYGTGDNSLRTLGTYINSGGKFGYPSGARGNVVQESSRVTTVELNSMCGQITLYPDSPSANTVDSFTLMNKNISSNDVIIVNLGSGASENCYSVSVTEVSDGSCRIQIQNFDSPAGSESPTINFAILRA